MPGVENEFMQVKGKQHVARRWIRVTVSEAHYMVDLHLDGW